MPRALCFPDESSYEAGGLAFQGCSDEADEAKQIKNQPDTKRVNLFSEPPELESMKFQRIRGAARTEKAIRSV